MYRFIKDLSIRSKLFILTLLPLLGFFYFSGSHLVDIYDSKVTLEEMQISTKAATVSALLVHELQKERGASAGFLGSNGDKFSDLLKKQRVETDQKIDTLNKFIKGTKLPYDLNELFIGIETKLDKLIATRTLVDNLAITVAKQVTFYTELNSMLLSITTKTANNSCDPQLALSATAIGSFLQHKERAGIERAVLSHVFAKNSFSPALLEKFIRLLAEQDAYLTNFKAHATPKQLFIYSSIVKGDAIKKVEKFRRIALDNMSIGEFGVDATTWFSTITAKINLLKQVEAALLDGYIATNQKLIDNASSRLVTVSIVVSISLLITIVFSLAIVWQLNHGIKEITTKLQNLVKSNDLTIRVDLDSKEELGNISTIINLLVGHLLSLVENIQSNSDLLGSRLSENADHTRIIAEKIDMGSDMVTQVVTAATQMNHTVAEIARNAIDASTETEQAAQESNLGSREVELTIENSNRLSKELNGASLIIDKLNDSSTNIGKFLNVIKSISDKTNLLALNAAIEAARAGESGRGFAVVADEVRSLAMQTKKSTTEIETMIEELQASSMAANTAMQSSIEMVENNVIDVQKTGDGIRQINTRINHITQMNEQVATAAEEQSSVTEEINRNMIHIQEGYVDMHKSYNEIEQGSLELERLSSTLNQKVAQFIIK